MREALSIILLFLLLDCTANAQNGEMYSLQLSLNQVELGYQHHILSEKGWVGLYAGIGNQDINPRFDDFLSGLKMGYNVVSRQKSQVDYIVGLGVYLPGNDYYKATTLVFDTGVRYSCFFGEKKRHCLLLSAGYRYGKRDYKQTYSSDILTVSRVGTFRVSPGYLSIGYGFRLN